MGAERPDHYKSNLDQYTEKYQKGYGLMYPDGHVIRIHKHILDYELNLKSGKILDFGCGNGTHLKYFHDNGFTPYGVDTNEVVIDQCKELLPAFKENFHVTKAIFDLSELFDREKFDIVFSNQVLYYLNDEDMMSNVKQIHKLLKPDGIFVVTMMEKSNYYYSKVKEEENGLSKVVLNGRLKETTWINFKTKEETFSDFKGYFDMLHLGDYRMTIRQDEGSSDHLIYVGRKR